MSQQPPKSSNNKLQLDVHQRRILAEFGIPGFISLAWAKPNTATDANTDTKQNSQRLSSPKINKIKKPTNLAPEITNITQQDNPTILTTGQTTNIAQVANSLTAPTLEQLSQGCQLIINQQTLALAHGDVNATWLFISEIPRSWQETQQSIQSRQLVNKMLTALNISSQQGAFLIELYPAHSTEQMQQITHKWLDYLMDLLTNKLTIVMGRKAGQTAFAGLMPTGKLRGDSFKLKKAQTIFTYSPELLLLRPQYKRPVWEDLQRAQALLVNTN